MSDPPDPPRRQFALKPKEFERVNAPPGATPAPAANDIFALQQDLRTRQHAAGMDALKPHVPRKSRRKTDFLVSLALGWGTFVLVGFLAGGGIGALAGVVLGIFYAGGLAWIMFGILSDY